MALPVESTLTCIRQMFDQIPSLFIGLGDDRRIMLWNAQAEQILGGRSADVVGRSLETCDIPWDVGRVYAGLDACLQSREPVRIDDLRCDRTTGMPAELGLTLIPLGESPMHGMQTMIIGADITERKLLEEQLAQAQKMEAIGHLAAGIAHEISTPAQFVGDNTHFLREAFDDLRQILGCFQSLAEAVRHGAQVTEPLHAIDAAVNDLDLDYLEEEVPLAIDHILDGVGRVSKIVRSMKFFAHPGDVDKAPLDLNEAIESTIIISRNEWKYVAEVETDFDGALPPVQGQRGEINQVILNLITNAAHAIAEKHGNSPATKGRIHITTRYREGWAEIRIQDTGAGIPDAIRHQVFDLFFTTKEEGVGSGQGLAIAHSVIVDKHGGVLTLDSEPGVGTTFIIRLPVNGEAQDRG
jgi:two-component system, NtrC family, sensor kinase